MTGGVARAVAITLAGFALVATTATGVAAPGNGSGALLAFGSNYYGQLGTATNVGTSTPNPTPTAVALPGATGPVTQFTAGDQYSLAVTSTGQLYAFGANFYGQLGSNVSGTSNPTPTLVSLPGEIGPVTQVAAGNGHSLVVTSSGQLYAFGQNQYGQLGVPSNALPNPTPTLVTLPGEIGPVTQVAAGEYHSLAVTSSGQLYAFGINIFGALGNATNINTASPNATPTLVGLPGQVGPVTRVAAGGNQSLAVTGSGQLYSFGYNYSGQLGIPTNAGSAVGVTTPSLVTLPGAVGGVAQVASGAYHSLALTASGQLYAFGGNEAYELGNSTASSTNANPTPLPVTLPGAIGRVTQIAAGDATSLAVTASGQLYGFGSNRYGQLGSTTNSGTSVGNLPAPVPLPAGTTIGKVVSGPNAKITLALVANLAITSAALAGGQVGVAYQGTVAAVGGSDPLTWHATGLPAGLTLDAATGALGGIPTAAGSFSPTVTLTDSNGVVVSRALTLGIAAPPAPTPVAPVAPVVPTSVAAAAARLSALTQTASRWLPGGRLPRIVTGIPRKTSGLPVGTTFGVTLDQPARLSLVFRRTATGRRVSGTCVATTKRNASKAHCTRTVTDGTLRLAARAGLNRIRFQGRLSAKVKLATGPHTVTISATNSAGKTSPARTLRFTIATPR